MAAKCVYFIVFASWLGEKQNRQTIYNNRGLEISRADSEPERMCVCTGGEGAAPVLLLRLSDTKNSRPPLFLLG